MVTRLMSCGLVALLALPAARGRDDPKQDKHPPPAKEQPEKKPLSAREQYDKLVKDFSGDQQKLIADFQKAKPSEQQKLIEKFNGIGKEYADRFFKLADENPNDAVAKDALFWILEHAEGNSKAEQKLVAIIAEMPLKDLNRRLRAVRISSAAFVDAVMARAEKEEKDKVDAADTFFWAAENSGGNPKAEQKLLTVVAEMPLKDLSRKLQTFRGQSPAFLEAVLKRAEKDEHDKLAGDLLGWVASKGPGFASPKQKEIVQKAIALLIEKYPDHPALARVCSTLARGRSPEDRATLKKIAEKVSSPKVKAEASLALGQSLSAQLDSSAGNAEQTEKLAAEADKYLAAAVELFDKEKMSARKLAAEKELKAFRTLRVGKEAPEISGKDLDGKEFKLSDYRGKVVLLDFWGNW